MPARNIEVLIFPAYTDQISKSWARDVAARALEQGLAHTDEDGGPVSLSLVIADDEAVRELNREYRGLDENTDVLAFAFNHPGQYEGDDPPPQQTEPEPFIATPEDSGYFGEVLVSYPQCVRQAIPTPGSTLNELALLITHGVLHLLGYDHRNNAEERDMQAMEDSTLAIIGLPVTRL
jgi:probable rRNA maturation factor